MPRPRTLIVAVILAAIVGAATYFIGSEVGLEAGRQAELHRVDCLLGAQYSSAVGQVPHHFELAATAFTERDLRLAAVEIGHVLDRFDESRAVIRTARSIADSPSWRTLASFDPREGLVALRTNLAASRSLGQGPVGSLSWEGLMINRGYVVFRVLYGSLGRSGYCPASVDLGGFPASLVESELTGSVGTELDHFGARAKEYMLLSISNPLQSARWTTRTAYDDGLRLLGVAVNGEAGNRSFAVIALGYDGTGYLTWYDYASSPQPLVPPGGEVFFSIALPQGINTSRIALRASTSVPAPQPLILRVVSLQSRTVATAPGSRLLNVTGRVENPTRWDARPATIGLVLLDINGMPIEMSDGTLGFVRIGVVPASSSAPFSFEFKTNWLSDPTVYRAFAWAPPIVV